MAFILALTAHFGSTAEDVPTNKWDARRGRRTGRTRSICVNCSTRSCTHVMTEPQNADSSVRRGVSRCQDVGPDRLGRPIRGLSSEGTGACFL